MKNKKAKNQGLPSTEKYLFAETVRDDTVVLKNGGLRAILMTSSINFALKSEDEQQGILQGYVSLLNSIDFPLQIVVQSRPLKIDNYLSSMDKRMTEIDNELLRVQLQDYKKYITELLSLGDIMSKKFYLVVPYEPGGGGGKKNFWTQVTEVFSSRSIINLSRKQFNEYKDELERRVSLVMAGLNNMGLSSVRLDTQGLIELLYNSYNPLISNWQKLPDINELNLEK
ncbi:MAG: hypothetical protein ACKKL5_00655 [Candidatus Komeilibacteria bacterium]